MASTSRPTVNPPFQSARHVVKDPIFSPPNHVMPRVCHALNTTAPDGADLLDKNSPAISQSGVVDEVERSNRGRVNLEDLILEDTVPLVVFVKMILHSGKYKCGDSLSLEHQKIMLERVLPYHPAYVQKIGCGVDHIMVGYHPEFGDTKCLFIVRKDGETVDFSYWKCIKGMIKKKYPSHAKNFIFRHLHRRNV